MRKVVNLLILCIMFLITGCSNSSNSSGINIFTTPIEQLKATPERFEDRTVIIAGTVTHSGGIGRKAAYMVDDGTGTIWVLDNTSAPAIGEEVRIRGQPKQLVRCGKRTITVFHKSNNE